MQYTFYTRPSLHKLFSFSQPPCCFTFTCTYIRATRPGIRLLISTANCFPCRILAFFTGTSAARPAHSTQHSNQPSLQQPLPAYDSTDRQLSSQDQGSHEPGPGPGLDLSSGSYAQPYHYVTYMYSIYITAQHTGPDQTSSQAPAPDQHTITASQHDQASGHSTAQHTAICSALRLRHVYVYVYDTFTIRLQHQHDTIPIIYMNLKYNRL